MRKPILAVGAVALAIPGVALAASGPTIKAHVKPNTPKAKSTLKVSAKGPFKETGLPTAMQFNLQKGFASSAKSVTALCDPTMVPPVGPSGCPTASQIGSGTATATVSGNPGSLPLTMYLGTKQQPTDIASVVLSATEGPLAANSVGRLFKTSSGQLELLFSDFGVLSGQPGTLHSIKFNAHAVNGKASLVKNPKACPKSHHWTGTFTLSFTSGTVTKKTKLACKG